MGDHFERINQQLNKHSNTHPILISLWKKYIEKKKLAYQDSLLNCEKILDQINLIPDISPSTLLTFQVLVNSYFDLNRI